MDASWERSCKPASLPHRWGNPGSQGLGGFPTVTLQPRHAITVLSWLYHPPPPSNSSPLNLQVSHKGIVFSQPYFARGLSRCPRCMNLKADIRKIHSYFSDQIGFQIGAEQAIQQLFYLSKQIECMSLLPLFTAALSITFCAQHPNLVRNIKLKTKWLITEITLHNENRLDVALRSLRAGTGWDMRGFTFITVARDLQKGRLQASRSPQKCLVWPASCF